MSDILDLTESIARLNALHERLRKATEATAQEEHLRKEVEDSSMQLIVENKSLKEEVTKEQQALQEEQEKANQLDEERKDLEEKLETIQSEEQTSESE